MTKFDAIGFGALNVDTLLKVDKIVGAEEESFIHDYTEACGGSAANTMVGLARLGCKVNLARQAPGISAAQLVRDLSRFQRIFNHPASEADGTLGNDQDLILSQVFHVVFHLGGEQVRTDAQAPVNRQRMVAHAHLFGLQAAINDPHQVAVHLQISTIGLDIATNAFQVYGIDAAEIVVV